MKRKSMCRKAWEEKECKRGVRGRVNATRLPEPLIVGDTQVKVCSRSAVDFMKKYS